MEELSVVNYHRRNQRQEFVFTNPLDIPQEMGESVLLM